MFGFPKELHWENMQCSGNILRVLIVQTLLVETHLTAAGALSVNQLSCIVHSS